MDQDFHRALNLDIKESIEALSRICQWQKSPRWIKQSIEQTESKEIRLNGLKKLSRFYREEILKS